MAPHNRVILVGHHKLTGEPIYMTHDSIVFTHNSSSSVSHCALGLDGWYTHEHPFDLEDISRMPLSEGINSIYTSPNTKK